MCSATFRPLLKRGYLVVGGVCTSQALRLADQSRTRQLLAIILALLGCSLLVSCSDETAHHHHLQNSSRTVDKMFDGHGRICVARDQICAVRTNGELGCWTETAGPVPFPVPDGWSTGIAMISCRFDHVCAVNTAGHLNCWGQNQFRQCSIPEPYQTNIAYVSADSDRTCAVTRDGELGCWGGDKANGGGSVQPLVNMTSNVSSVSASSPSCAITVDAELRCWGVNGAVETPPNWDYDIAQVSCAWNSICARKVDGELNCWLYNATAVNATGQTVSYIPAAAAGSFWNSSIVSVATTGFVTCVAREDGDAQCWGFAEGIPGGVGNVTTVVLGPRMRCVVGSDSAVACTNIVGDGFEDIDIPAKFQELQAAGSGSSSPPPFRDTSSDLSSSQSSDSNLALILGLSIGGALLLVLLVLLLTVLMCYPSMLCCAGAQPEKQESSAATTAHMAEVKHAVMGCLQGSHVGPYEKQVSLLVTEGMTDKEEEHEKHAADEPEPTTPMERVHTQDSGFSRLFDAEFEAFVKQHGKGPNVTK